MTSTASLSRSMQPPSRRRHRTGVAFAVISLVLGVFVQLVLTATHARADIVFMPTVSAPGYATTGLQANQLTAHDIDFQTFDWIV